jgi:hypothetical protein
VGKTRALGPSTKNGGEVSIKKGPQNRDED